MGERCGPEVAGGGEGWLRECPRVGGRGFLGGVTVRGKCGGEVNGNTF